MVRKEGSAKIPAAAGLGLLLGMIITLIGALITAWLIQAQKIGEDTVGLAAMVIILLGASASTAVTAGKGSSARFLMCLAGGGIYFLGLLCCGAMLFEGVKAGVVPTACVAAAGSMLVYLLGTKRGRRTNYKVPKVRI